MYQFLSFRVEISDGFTKLKKNCIMNGGEKLKVFDVIRTEEVSASFKDGKHMVLIENFTLIRDDINAMIGNPINYSEWEQTKKNPNGDNTLPPRKPKNTKPPQQPIKQLPGGNSNQSIPQSRPLANQGPAKNNFPQHQVNRQSDNNSNTMSSNFQAKNQQQPIKPVQKSGANMPQQNTNQSNQSRQNPPPQQQNNRNIAQTKPQEDRHDRTYTLIKELYEEIENWKIKVRVLFRTEVRIKNTFN